MEEMMGAMRLVSMRSGLRVPFEDIARHRGRLMNNLRRLKVPACDRADVMQEILLAAWRTVEAGGFHARDSLSGQEALRRWLFAVTWHHTTRYWEHRHRWDKGRASYTHPAMDGHMPPSFEQVDARLTLRVLQRLKPDLRAVLVDAALGYTATEIAVELRKNPHTTLGRIHRGRRRFREALRRWRAMRCPGGERQGRAG